MALGMTVQQLTANLNSRELSEWAAFEKIHGFPAGRNEHQTALLATILANSNRASGKPPFKFEDFLLFTPRQKETMAGAARAFFSDLKSKMGSKK